MASIKTHKSKYIVLSFYITSVSSVTLAIIRWVLDTQKECTRIEVFLCSGTNYKNLKETKINNYLIVIHSNLRSPLSLCNILCIHHLPVDGCNVAMYYNERLMYWISMVAFGK
jgi:hypothetical protein